MTRLLCGKTRVGEIGGKGGWAVRQGETGDFSLLLFLMVFSMEFALFFYCHSCVG